MSERRKPIYLVGLPNLGVGLLWAMNISLIPMLVGTYHVSNFEVGLLVSMGAFTGIFVQYLAGVLSDRSRFKMGRRKPFMLIGALATAVFLGVMPFAPGYGWLFVLSFLFYFSLNFYQGPYYSLIPEVVDESQLGAANGFARVISVLGGAFIFIAGPIFWNMKSTINYHHSLAFFIAALLAILTVVVTFFFIKENPDKSMDRPKRLSFDFMRFPSVIKFNLVVFFVYLGHGSLTPFFVKYCVNGLGLTENTASFSLLLLTVVGAAFAYPMGLLADKITRKRVMVIGILLYGLALLTGNFVKDTMALYGIMSVVGIGFVTVQVTSYAILAELVPPVRLGEFMGFFNFFISVSQFIANITMGMLLDHLGYRIYFPLAAIYVLTAAVLLETSRLKKYQADARERVSHLQVNG